MLTSLSQVASSIPVDKINCARLERDDNTCLFWGTVSHRTMMTLSRSATAAMPGIGAAEVAICIAGLANKENMAPMVDAECRV